MAKTTKKTTASGKNSRRKTTSAKESSKSAKKSTGNSRRKQSTSNAKTTRSRKNTTGSSKKKTGGDTKKRAGDREVTVDRRRADRRTKSKPEAAEERKIERRAKVNRRRQIDPTTCERDYSGDEVEFMNALDDYKRTSGRMFPTCSEILEVIRKLGYVKMPQNEDIAPDPSRAETPASPAENGGEEPAENVPEEVLV